MREIILTKSNRWFQNENREYKEIGFTHVIKHEQIVRSEHMQVHPFPSHCILFKKEKNVN